MFSNALQAGMQQLAKDVRSTKLLNPNSTANEMMERSATLLATYEQLQVIFNLYHTGTCNPNSTANETLEQCATLVATCEQLQVDLAIYYSVTCSTKLPNSTANEMMEQSGTLLAASDQLQVHRSLVCRQSKLSCAHACIALPAGATRRGVRQDQRPSTCSMLYHNGQSHRLVSADWPVATEQHDQAAAVSHKAQQHAGDDGASCICCWGLNSVLCRSRGRWQIGSAQGWR